MLITLLNCAGMVCGLESPELLTVIESDKRGIITEKLSIDSIFVVFIGVLNIHILVGGIYYIVTVVVVGKMALSARCGLNHTPYPLIGAGFKP